MYILKSDSTDAYYNLALEEYLLNNYDEDFFIINNNEPSIILGINQNAYEEINALYVKKSSIKVARRITGGGAIFQDYGNLNFSYIYKDDGSGLYDFDKVSQILKSFLSEKLNLEISYNGYNHLHINGKKFGGFTKLKVNNKILLHSTLVISSNKKFLVDAYKLQSERGHDRALRSNHDKIASISAHLKEPVPVEKFKDMFYTHIRNIFPDAKIFELSPEDNEKIKELVDNKYSTWQWNYGDEVVYNFSGSYTSKAGNIELLIQIEDNIIKNIRIFGDFFSQKSIHELENSLAGCPYDRDSITKVLQSFNLGDYIEMVDTEEFLDNFFK